MRYDAEAATVAGEHYATLQAATPAGEALALRHARAMRAVLLAARAWARAGVGSHYGDATDRLARAQERLEKIEKEVTRG